MEPVITNLNEVVENVPLEKATFGDRFFAAFVDNLIVKIPLRIAFMFLMPLWSNPYFALFFVVAIELVITLLYFAMYNKHGQTLGKKWNKVKVTDLKGNELTLVLPLT